MPLGTGATIAVVVALVGSVRLPVKDTKLLGSEGSNCDPLIVTGVPAVPTVGENPEMIGPPLFAVTTNGVLLVADPDGVVTLIGPVVAPVGTVVTICVAVALCTTAAVPLNATLFWLAVALKPPPEIVTVVPTGPVNGMNPLMPTPPTFNRSIARMLPTAS